MTWLNAMNDRGMGRGAKIISYRPALADLPDQKGWRIKADADYGPLSI